MVLTGAGRQKGLWDMNPLHCQEGEKEEWTWELLGTREGQRCGFSC